MDYLTIKWLHILASTLVFGTGLGIAFFCWIAHRGGDPRVIAATARTVVIADACFTAPAVLTQLLTGLWLMHTLGLPYTQLWIALALALFVLIGLCWLPVLWLQWRAARLAADALASGTPLPAEYHRVMRWWFWLGWPAFLAVLAIFWLMVMKPV
ncbi:MAG: DUF2269 domain-containing protein [Xanthomonadales bacterium]|nr:DUF2269 domain-containing protein [Xanthomonadales bacterium]MBK7144876.1 DUF2269 domain-containing protein [Xanthomonadales bacterium]MCC6560087.1 DUF2269 domain-containing protein [Xanthomonadales bacterium]